MPEIKPSGSYLGNLDKKLSKELNLKNCCLILPQRRKGLSPDLDQDQNIDTVTPPMEHKWEYLISPSGKKSERINNNNQIIVEIDLVLTLKHAYRN